MSRRPPAPREAVRRFEWPCPGDLLQMDTKRLARFTRPGTRRDRRSLPHRRRARAARRLGVLSLDDRRPQPPGLHRDPPRREGRRPSSAFVERALEFFAAHGITARRLQTDNAWTYIRNRGLRDLLAERGIRTARSRRGRPSATARSSATSRPSPANGPTDSATATQTPAPQRCPSGSSTTTSPATTARSQTGRPSPAFGTSRGTTASVPGGRFAVMSAAQLHGGCCVTALGRGRVAR